MAKRHEMARRKDNTLLYRASKFDCGFMLIALQFPVSPAAAQADLNAFRQGMVGLGLEEGRNFTLVARGELEAVKTAAKETRCA